MKDFFPQISEFQINNSLKNAEGLFSAKKSSGLVVNQTDTDQVAVLVFAGGISHWAFVTKDNKSTPILLSEFSSLAGSTSSLRVIQLPDTAARLTWLALESENRNKYKLESKSAWKDQLELWHHDRWNGMIEVTGRDLHGFVFFREGQTQKSEMSLATNHGFTSDINQMESEENFPIEITTYEQNNSSQAYQCTILRQGATHWSRQILGNYREIVGQKLSQQLEGELNRQIQPWQWKISLANSILTDAHFFPHVSDAAQAYRALLMEMGSQMNFVIGSNLTQKILNDTFEKIHPEESTVLHTQRLIPAAISE